MLLPLNKASGLYSIPTRILKSARHIISKPLADIIHISLIAWKYHIDYVASKISRTIGIIARLRHFIPLSTLLTIYRSLVAPYLTYGIIAWGQAAKSNLCKILLLQKRALRLMLFFPNRNHTLPLFFSSDILPINLLYFETVSIFMHDVPMTLYCTFKP